jgi:hypothetical protein
MNIMGPFVIGGDSYRERSVFPHAALPYVASFPPAELPAFSGTTKPSDSLVIFAVLPLQLSGILLNESSEEDVGSPRFPHNHNVRHATVTDPGEAECHLPVRNSQFWLPSSAKRRPSHFITLRGSIPSTLRLAAYLLAVLRLKRHVTIPPPRTCYPVTSLSSGAGVTPAGLYDLAWPHAELLQYPLR